MTDALIAALQVPSIEGPDYLALSSLQKDGSWAYCGRYDLDTFAGDDADIDEHLRETFGAGQYKIDPRKKGKRGSAGSIRQVTIAASRPLSAEFPRYGHSAPAAAPPPVGQDLLMTLITQMMAMNQQMMLAVVNRPQDGLSTKDIIDLVKEKRTPVDELEGLVRFGKTLASGGAMEEPSLVRELIAAVPDAVATMKKLSGVGQQSEAPPKPAPNQPNQPHMLPPAAPPPPPPEHQRSAPSDDRLALFVNLLLATRDAERDPDDYARILIDALDELQVDELVGLDNLSVINWMKVQYPQIVPQSGFIAQVMDTLRSIISGGPATDADGSVDAGPIPDNPT